MASMQERFDKLFNKPISDEVHRYLCSPNKIGVYYDNTAIKAFIQSEIDLAVAEDRKRIVEEIEEYIRVNKGINPLPTIEEGVATDILSLINHKE